MSENPFASPESNLEVHHDDDAGDSRMVYADFGSRFAALLVDGILIAILNNLFQYCLRYVIPRDGFSDQMFPFLIGVVNNWLYEALQESSEAQATLGKRMLGIKLTDLDGRRLTFARATGRHFGKYLSVLTFFIGYLMQPFNERKQALHDMLAGCLVVKS